MSPNVKAFFREFPFLWNDFANLPITETKVSRIDEGLLRKPLVEYSKGWSGNSSIYFYKADGQAVAGYGRWLSFLIVVLGHKFDETLSSKLEGKTAEITHYIAWYKEGRDDNILTLYKAPKGFSVATWLATLETAAKVDFARAVAQIDAEAEQKTA